MDTDPIVALRKLLAERRGLSEQAPKVSPELAKPLSELSHAAQSAAAEFKAIHKKLAPHAGMTAPRGEDVMMIREVTSQLVELMGELQTSLKDDFGV